MHPKIKAGITYSVVRDGGSHHHLVLNPDECGFNILKQDFRIRSTTLGEWFGLTPDGVKVPVSAENIEWVGG